MSAANGRRGERGGLASSWTLLAILLPLWGLWAYSVATLVALEGAADQLPAYLGVHLNKESVQARLGRLCRAVETQGGASDPWPPPGENGDRPGGIGLEEMVRLFGMEGGFVILHRDSLQVLYPDEPRGALGRVLGDPDTHRAFRKAAARLSETGGGEGFFRGASRGQGAVDGETRWYLTAREAGAHRVCLYVLEASALEGAGEVLRSAQQVLLRERVERYVWITLPILLLASLLTVVFLLAGRRRSGGDGVKEGPDA